MLVFACGVMIMGSSLSSWSRASASSDELFESSEPSMFMLPTELEAPVLSPWLQPPCMFTLGDSSNMEFERGFRGGILIPFCVMVGEESGEDASGRVEWWRLVHALENSAPRERRGRSDAGDADAYVFRESSWGDSGTRAAKCAGLGMCESPRGGIWRERPRERKSGLRGVLGLAMMVWSSFDMRAGSRNFGDGSRRGALSDSERAFGDFAFFSGVCVVGERPAASPSPTGSRLLALCVVIAWVNIASDWGE